MLGLVIMLSLALIVAVVANTSDHAVKTHLVTGDAREHTREIIQVLSQDLERWIAQAKTEKIIKKMPKPRQFEQKDDQAKTEKIIPMLILNRDRKDYLEQSILRLGKLTHPHKIYVVDLGSSYTPMMELLQTLKKKDCKKDPTAVCVVSWGDFGIVPSKDADPMQKLNQLVNLVLDKIKKDIDFDYYLVTDSDVVFPDETPNDVLHVFKRALDAHTNMPMVGPALKIDDLPDTFGHKAEVVQWEGQFWSSMETLVHNGVDVPMYRAPIDTTMAMYRSSFRPFHNFNHGFRVAGPYVARHLDWYLDDKSIPADITWYRDHKESKIGYWSSKQASTTDLQQPLDHEVNMWQYIYDF